MNEFREAWKKVDRNKVALLLSVIPGLGHFYKHHYLAGTGLMIGNIVVAFVALWLAIATFGFSLILVPVLWVTAVACSAYFASDQHGCHPWLHVWENRRNKASLGTPGGHDG
ncbi:MAG: hypothetical protein V4733_10210 [Verrucomicrobiota bacterium]